MVTRPTNHKILTRDQSHDLLTWPRYMTYKLHSDIKLLLIPTSASSLPCHDYIQVPHLSYDYYIFSRVIHQLSVLFEQGAQTKKTTPRWTPGSNPVVVLWVGFTSIAINESHWREPQIKW